MSEPVKRYRFVYDGRIGMLAVPPWHEYGPDNEEYILLSDHERAMAEKDETHDIEVASLKAQIGTLYQAVTSLKARCEGLREALEAAAKSLETLSNAGLREQPLLDTMQNVRGYANSRATVALAALSSLPVEGLVPAPPAKRCEKCGCPITGELTPDSCWCGVVVKSRETTGGFVE